ncbi:hemolysin family protein [Pseudohaliea sp.]|uniref:hemolysin family protein n=1 Tax=Pseudohaliea sp. TaxID=2740289 RepID=UPI0032EF4B6A
MTGESAAILLCMVILLLLQGFFSGSEIALVNADKLKLRHLAASGRRGAQHVLRMFQHPEVLLGTTLVGTNVSLVAFTTLGTLLLSRVFGGFAEVAALLLLTPLTLIFGEIVPKSVYQQSADALAPRLIYPLRLFSLLFYPVVLVFSGLARLAVRLTGVTPPRQGLFTTREQVRLMLEGAEQAANVDVFDRDRLLRAVRFASITAGEVMVPIGEVIMVSRRDTTEEAIEIARCHGYFRLPVYVDEPGQIAGAVSLDLWDLMDPALPQRPLDALCKPVHYVVKDQLVDEIVGSLQGRDDHMAIVVDEFGSAIGMITLEDILEQVVGEVAQLNHRIAEHPVTRRPRIERLGPESFSIDGRALLADVGELIGIPLEEPGVNTIGGLLISRLRRLPREGDNALVAGYRFTVTAMKDRAVRTVVVEPD